jgi:excisionase family DNA binding protein
MYNESESVFLITETKLKDLLQQTIRNEFSILEEKLTKKSRILTREEAAEKLKVCPNTISEYVKSGRLINMGVGRKILVNEHDLEKVKPNNYTLYKKAS